MLKVSLIEKLMNCLDPYLALTRMLVTVNSPMLLSQLRVLISLHFLQDMVTAKGSVCLSS